MVRVLFVNTATAPPLGADTWVHGQIMRDLDRATHRVYAACVSGPPGKPTPTFEMVRTIPDLWVRPVDFGPELYGRSPTGRILALLDTARALPSIASLARFARQHGVQVIHTSDRPRDAAACALLARLTGAKCIIQVHVGYGEWMSPLLRFALRRADAVVAVSSHVKATLTAAGYPSDKVHVVLNAIDLDSWQPGAGRAEARRELGVSGDDPVLVTVCRLFPAKGPGELVQALPRLRQHHPTLRLVVVGAEFTAGYLVELQRQARDLAVAEHVVFTGRRPDVPRLMAAADIYAMPSREEPFGLVFLEAMAMKLPVVALASGGAPEVIEEGVTGLMSRPGDAEHLVANLLRLLDDAALRQQMGEAGRRRVEQYFTGPRMARETGLVYRSVISGEAAATRSDGPEKGGGGYESAVGRRAEGASGEP